MYALKQAIEQQRKKLNQMIEQSGIGNYDVLVQSKKLDELILEYQKKQKKGE